MTRIFVVIPSLGRASTLCKTVDRLADQTRPPDGIVLSVTSAADVAGMAAVRSEPHILLSERGASTQRNTALEAIGGRADVVVFFDDDFVPALDYLEQAERLFEEDPEIVGLTGELVADGIHGASIHFEDAARRLDIERERPRGEARAREALYGCNMAVRMPAASDLRFDERLPLYSWQEDIDYTYRLGKRGKLLSTPRLTGIHLGVRGARQPGKRLGYSQVANIVYLSRKGTMQPGLGRRLMLQNLASNLVRSAWPEAGIDRRGRLHGNLIALGDWLRGRLDPMKVTSF